MSFVLVSMLRYLPAVIDGGSAIYSVEARSKKHYIPDLPLFGDGNSVLFEVSRRASFLDCFRTLPCPAAMGEARGRKAGAGR